MLSEEKDLAEAGLELVLRPNRSLSDRGAMLVFCAAAIPVLTIGCVFYAIGLPLVLPFSGAEVVGLGAGLWWTSRRLDIKEVVSIRSGRVIVQRGRHYPEQTHEFDSAWVRIVVEQPQEAWYRGRLLLRSHGREIEIGEGLTDAERSELATRLQRKVHASQQAPRPVIGSESIISMGDKHACT